MECSLEKGLYCDPMKGSKETCPDFEISVLCQCEDKTSTVPSLFNECILTEPYRAIHDDCFSFLQCGPGLLGNQWVKKACGPGTMFNEKIQVCDWPSNVAVVRPECSKDTDENSGSKIDIVSGYTEKNEEKVVDLIREYCVFFVVSILHI